MDSPDCTYLVLSDHCFLSDYVCWLCMEHGDDRRSRSVCGGGLPARRSTAPNLDVSECSGFRHRLALGEIRGHDYPCFPISNVFVASNSNTDHSRFLSLSDPISYDGGDCHSWNPVLGKFEPIEKDARPSESCLTIHCPRKTQGSFFSQPRGHGDSITRPFFKERAFSLYYGNEVQVPLDDPLQFTKLKGVSPSVRSNLKHRKRRTNNDQAKSYLAYLLSVVEYSGRVRPGHSVDANCNANPGLGEIRRW